MRLSVTAGKVEFFNARAVKNDADKIHAKTQGRFGAYARRVMRNSIKYKKGTAAAGEPPHAHRSDGFTKSKRDKKTGVASRQPQSPLRELIFFARDTATNTTVIGPILFGKGGAGALEHGGATKRTNPQTGLTEVVMVAPHPFAKPAGETAAAKLPEFLRQSIR